MLREQHRGANVVPNERPGHSNEEPTLLWPGSYGTTLAPPGVVLAPPGVVLIPQWRPDPGDAVSADGAETPLYYGYAGVGRK
jgi:hypothetical protein